MNLPDIGVMEAYIRQAAAARGIDPETAVRVAKSEGLAPGVWQANGMLSYGRERSYGPFQLHVDPRAGHGGMGNDFMNATGLDPADPANWQAGIDFALNHAAKRGWGAWYGARKIGVTGMAGINGGQAIPVSAPPAMGAAMGGFAGGPAQVAARSLQGVNVQSAGGPAPQAPQPKNNAYTQMMARSLDKGNTPANEAAKVMANVTTPGTGIQMPKFNLGSLFGGGGGGKSGGGTGGLNAQPSPTSAPVSSPVSTPTAPPAAEAAAALVPPTPRLRPQTQNMSLPPVQGPNQPYFETVNPEEGAMWNDTAYEDSPGGAPYDQSKSPVYDRGRKRFMPPSIPR